MPLEQKFYPLLLLLLIVYSCRQSSNVPNTINTNEPKLLEKINSNHSNIYFKNEINDTTNLTIFDSDLIYSGAGTAIADFNNDGLSDIIFIGNQVPSKLYLNKGDFRFEDITEGSGFITNGWSNGVAVADINADGWLDIYVCVTGFKNELDKKNMLFINNQDLTFTERAAEYGVDDNGSSSSATFFDYDNDSDLDLFVVNFPAKIENTFEIPFYLDKNRIDTLNCNQFYENVDGKYINATVKSNLGYKNADGFQISVADLNNDGYLDIYINNDLLQPDFLYYNNGDGTFTERMNELLKIVPLFSMGSSFADVNNDGLLDIITTEMMPKSHSRRKNNMVHHDVEFFSYLLKGKFESNQQSRNMLQIQNSDGTFSEIGEMANMSRTDWSWAALPCDFNMDGYEDLFITNGVKRDVFDQTYINLNYEDGEEIQQKKYSHDNLDLILNWPVYLPQNYMLKNLGDLTYQPVMDDWGIKDYVASQGTSYGDLNNDGYPDLIVSNTDSLCTIYKNNGKKLLGNNFLKLRFKGEGKNTFGLGVKVKVHNEGKVMFRQLQNALGFQSTSEPSMFFGLQNIETIDSIEIRWLSGKVQILYNVPTDTTLTIVEANASKVLENDNSNSSKTLFTASKKIEIKFKHQENNFIDFKRDKLIHKMLSREGPGLAIGDINNDGLEDLYIGGANGQSGELFIQSEKGDFSSLKNQPWHLNTSAEDIGVVFIDIDNDGYQDLITTSGSNEFNENSDDLKDRIYMNNGNGNFEYNVNMSSLLPKTSTAVVKTCDINKDGFLDLFIGGRIENTKYPSSPKSYLYINKGGKLVDETENMLPNSGYLGMVSDAKFYDFNNDSKDDLMLVGEWMPITILEQTEQKFIDRTDFYGLSETQGWWNSMALADFNNDGEIDFVAGNHGTNSIFNASKEEPVVLYAGKFGKTEKIFPIICYYKDGILAPYADRDLWLRTLPSYNNEFLTYDAYARLSISDILTKSQISKSDKFLANDLRSSLFIRSGNKFIKHTLPNEAQVAPVYGLTIMDQNNDGYLDIIMCGNSYSSGYAEGPMGAMRGLLLLGSGDGSFQAVSSLASGLNIDADAKSLGVLKLNSLNKSVLIVGINNDSLRVYDMNFDGNMSDSNRNIGNGYLFNYTQSNTLNNIP